MPDMMPFDRQRLIAALVLAVMAAFVASGMPGAIRWRGELRAVAIVGFAVAVAWALVEIALWSISIER